jgi:hypothetical protein
MDETAPYRGISCTRTSFPYPTTKIWIEAIVAASAMPAANLWITDSSPPGFSFKDDGARRRAGSARRR